MSKAPEDRGIDWEEVAQYRQEVAVEKQRRDGVLDVYLYGQRPKDFPCLVAEDPDEPDDTITLEHRVPTLATAYGWRAVCREHRKVWTCVWGGQPTPEKYADGGMFHNGK